MDPQTPRCDCPIKNRFLSDSRDTLIAPKTFFASMALTGGYREPVMKLALYGLIAGVLGAILNLNKMGPAALWLSVVITPITSIIAGFIGALFILVVSLICKGSKNFEHALRVMAAIAVLQPIQVLATGVFIHISPLLFILGALAVSLYGLYLLYLALTTALQGKPKSAAIVTGALSLLMIALMGASAVAYHLAPNIAGQMTEQMMQRAAEDPEVAERMQQQLDQMMQNLDPDTRRQFEDAMREAQADR